MQSESRVRDPVHLPVVQTGERAAEQANTHGVLRLLARFRQADVPSPDVQHPEIAVVARVVRSRQQGDEVDFGIVPVRFLPANAERVVIGNVVLRCEAVRDAERERRIARCDEVASDHVCSPCLSVPFHLQRVYARQIGLSNQNLENSDIQFCLLIYVFLE